MVRVSVVAVCCLSAGFAFAQTPTVPAYIQAKPDDLTKAYGEELATRVFSDEFTDLRQQGITQSLQGIPNLSSCAEGFKAALYDLYPYGTNPEQQAWVERYVVACEREVRRTLLFIQRDGQVDASILAPGTTLADPELQYTTIQSAEPLALGAIGNNCDKVRVVDTVFLNKPNSTGAWDERWSLLGCGKPVSIYVRYVPVPEGGMNVIVLQLCQALRATSFDL